MNHVKSAFLSCMLLVSGCQRLDGEQGTEKGAAENAPNPEPMSRVAIAMTDHKVIFDGRATEVTVTINNQRTEPIAFAGLTDNASLVLDNGAVLPIHELSVGVAKPLRVAAGQRVQTSLLFTGAGAAPVKLKLLKADVPLSARSTSRSRTFHKGL